MTAPLLFGHAWVFTTLSLTVGLLGEIARLFSFVAVLWTLSDLIPVHLFGQSYVIPGYLVWAALIYAVVGTAITHCHDSCHQPPGETDGNLRQDDQNWPAAFILNASGRRWPGGAMNQGRLSRPFFQM